MDLDRHNCSSREENSTDPTSNYSMQREPNATDSASSSLMQSQSNRESNAASSKLFHCSYCDTSQKVKTNTITAKLYIEDASGISHSLRAYSDSLSDIVVADVISIENLLDSPPFSITYNDFNVITSITRD